MANFDLSKLMEGKNPQQVMLAETRELRSKWEQTGLLEGLKEREQSQISVLLENQAKQLLDEATATGTSAGSEEWSGVALPLVRRIFGEIASKEFVSVQPMNLPSGLIFYLDFKYGTAQAGNPAFDTKSLFGGTGNDLGSTDSAVNGLYGEGRFGYTVNDVSAADVTVISQASASWDEVGYDSALSASVADGSLAKIIVAQSGLEGADLDAVRSFVLADTAIDDFYPAHSKVSGANFVFFVSQTGTIAAVDSISYSKQPTDITRGDFEDKSPVMGGSSPSGTALDIPEVDLELKSEAIVAKTRKLKAVWTPELAQDLNAYHSIDAEAELTSMLSEYISQEIDFEILDMLIQDAKTTGYWSSTVGREWNGSAFADYSSVGASASAFTQGAWFQTLGTVIAGVSNKIHQKTLRGGANFLVVSPDVATIIESIPGYASTADNGDAQFAFGVTKIGSLNSRFQVYKNPYMKENVILMGYRGTQFLETGAVYSPYIPLIMTPLVYDPKNFTPRKGVMTRYAKKMLRGEFYGKVYVDGLHKIQ